MSSISQGHGITAIRPSREHNEKEGGTLDECDVVQCNTGFGDATGQQRTLNFVSVFGLGYEKFDRGSIAVPVQVRVHLKGQHRESLECGFQLRRMDVYFN